MYKKLVHLSDIPVKVGPRKEGAGANKYDRGRLIGRAGEENGIYCFGQ